MIEDGIARSPIDESRQEIGYVPVKQYSAQSSQSDSKSRNFYLFNFYFRDMAQRLRLRDKVV